MNSVNEPRVGCGAAIVVDGRILLLRRLKPPEAGCWGLAGGKIDLFETAAAAMRREVLEELGIVVTDAAWLCFVDQIDRQAGTHWVAPIYRVTAFTGTPRNMEPTKHEGPAWFALDALPERLTTPTKAALAALRVAGEGWGEILMFAPPFGDEPQKSGAGSAAPTTIAGA